MQINEKVRDFEVCGDVWEDEVRRDHWVRR